ncbi:hypothetical protein [uncultured Tistrella sp.]|uniref:hypothetical protein n=1 Tax=Tistrella mobilis TaxID=171437 RepID=UPI00260A7599|nr:hypothetical protein [uncultured Tistrella sp.]
MKSYISSISHHHSVDGHEDGARPGWSRPVLRPLAIALDTLAGDGSAGYDGTGCPS